MKDAVSEANLTVVAIILIAIILSVMRPLINSMMLSTAWKTCCADAGGVVDGNACELPDGDSISSEKVYNKEERKCSFED